MRRLGLDDLLCEFFDETPPPKPRVERFIDAVERWFERHLFARLM